MPLPPSNVQTCWIEDSRLIPRSGEPHLARLTYVSFVSSCLTLRQALLLELVQLVGNGRELVTNRYRHVRAASGEYYADLIELADKLLRLETCCVYEILVAAAMPVQEPMKSPPVHQAEPIPVWGAIADQMVALFGPPSNVKETTRTFFERVHPWLPFLSQQRFHHRFSSTRSHPEDHAFQLIPCVMQLVVTIPAAAEVSSRRSLLYRKTKQLIALTEAEGPPTLDLVQCRLLLALYEINHGATDEAYMSLGMCSRMGTVLGLHRHLQQPGHDDWALAEEKRRTWWAIIILDRFIRQQRPHWSSLAKDPSSSDILPIDDTEWERMHHDTSDDSPSPPLPISTTSHIRVGYFARLAQVAHLLGLVLNNTYNPTPDAAFNQQEAEQLRQTLDMYAELLPREATATECSHYCGVVMMCYSAQLLLEKPKTSTHGMNARTEMLTATMIQMARELNIEFELMGPELLRPLALFATYQVAMIYVEQCTVTADARHTDGIITILQLLEIFNGRWKIAGEFASICSSSSSDQANLWTGVYRGEIEGELRRLLINV